MNIGDVIASVRRRKRIEQKDLADSLSVSVSYLSQIEKNRKKPSLKLLKKIAEKLEIPLSSLIFQSMEENHISNEEERNLFHLARPIMETFFELWSNYQIDTDVKETKKKKQKKKGEDTLITTS